MATPLLPVELEALIQANITDPLDQQNTAQRVREVLLYMVASMGSVLPPGGPTDPDYATLLQAIAQKADKTALANGLAGKEQRFVPFTQQELTTVEYAYSNLALKPLLRELIRAAAAGVAPGGSSAPFTDDILVSLGGGRTFGKYQNGQTIPAKGKTANEVILLAAIEAINPTYSTASLSLSQSAPQDGEVGETVNNALTATFNQADAGGLNSIQINKDGARISTAGTASPFTRNSNVVRTLAPIVYQALVSYGAGPVKNVQPANTPDTRPAAVRNPNAPQAAESNLGSNQVQLNGYYRLFFGATSASPADSTTARALPQNQLTNAGNQGTLTTGTSALKFAIVLPPGRTLQSVTDLDNQGLNLTAKYVAQATISVADAGGALVPGYTPYVLSVATPYTSSARHQFVYA